jgi:hypothetical protein
VNAPEQAGVITGVFTPEQGVNVIVVPEIEYEP